MKRSPPNTTLLALSLAAGLFLVANYFDDKPPWQPEDLPRASLDPRQDPASREPPVTAQSGITCEAAEAEMLRAVEDSRYCESDEDCTLFDYGYPIQCMTSVSMEAVTALRLQYREYDASCRYRVFYDCDAAGAERIAVCRNKRCGVEIATLDTLTDETLDHLGIDR
ncbi:MAG TPA: hypothetical protein VLB07_10135 [Woeseiaceae bacterium]|jgi:hypothetical protein|nr:hypothetical protein [Woeseiaceae bacterium]